MKKSFTSSEVIGLISATLFGVLFFVPILGNLPLIENDFIFYGTMLPILVMIIYGFLISTSKEKVNFVKVGLFVLIVFIILMLLGLELRDVYFLSLSLTLLLYIFGVLMLDSNEEKKESVKKVTKSSRKLN
jgi:predicted tellurium resistance membrane protein TerC